MPMIDRGARIREHMAVNTWPLAILTALLLDCLTAYTANNKTGHKTWAASSQI